MPRKGNWSCLFLPWIETLIRKRIRRCKAPPGSAIPRREECEKDSIGALACMFPAGDCPWTRVGVVRLVLSFHDLTYRPLPRCLLQVPQDLPFSLKPWWSMLSTRIARKGQALGACMWSPVIHPVSILWPPMCNHGISGGKENALPKETWLFPWKKSNNEISTYSAQLICKKKMVCCHINQAKRWTDVAPRFQLGFFFVGRRLTISAWGQFHQWSFLHRKNNPGQRPTQWAVTGNLLRISFIPHDKWEVAE